MCNFGQSMDNKKVNEVINNQKELTIIFDIQSTGEKYNLKAKQKALKSLSKISFYNRKYRRKYKR